MNRNHSSWSLPFRYTTGLILFLGFAAFLIWAREALKMFVIAAFAAYLISPIVVFLTSRTKISRTAAVNLVYFSALILLVGLPAALTPIFFDDIKIVAQDLLALSRELSRMLAEPIYFGGMVFRFEELAEGLAHWEDVALKPLPEEALELLEATSINVLWLLVILVTVYLLMSQWPRIKDGLLGLVPGEYSDEMRELYSRLREVWMAYLRGQIVLMVVVGVVFTIAWMILGIPGALVLGMAAGLFTLIPDIGPFLAAALAVGVALLEGSSSPMFTGMSNVWVAGIVTAVYLVLINLKNFLLRPYIMGRSLHMNEGLIFVIIITATILAGIMGALLVVPLLASASVIFDYLRRRILDLPPFEESGARPFSTPPEKLKPRGRNSNNKKKKNS
jgi:predicted PurR-regulated permease PerM